MEWFTTTFTTMISDWPKTEVLSLMMIGLIILAFSIAAWLSWREERSTLGGARRWTQSCEKGGEHDAGGHHADDLDDHNVGGGHLGLLGR